jgi:hypothetical protein
MLLQSMTKTHPPVQETFYELDLHYPTCKLIKVQKGVSFTGTRIFNKLPLSIKNL